LGPDPSGAEAPRQGLDNAGVLVLDDHFDVQAMHAQGVTEPLSFLDRVMTRAE